MAFDYYQAQFYELLLLLMIFAIDVVVLCSLVLTISKMVWCVVAPLPAIVVDTFRQFFPRKLPVVEVVGFGGIWSSFSDTYLIMWIPSVCLSDRYRIMRIPSAAQLTFCGRK